MSTIVLFQKVGDEVIISDGPCYLKMEGYYFLWIDISEKKKEY